MTVEEDTFVDDFVNARAGIGHNNPPADVDPLIERLREGVADLIATRDDKYIKIAERWEKERPTIDNDDQSEAATNYLKKLGELLGAFEKKREAEKKPFLDAGRKVDGFFKGETAILVASDTSVRKKLGAYQQKKLKDERERKAKAEEEARKAVQEAKTEEQTVAALGKVAAAAAPIEPVRTRTDTGALASARTVWSHELVDLALVPREYLMLNPDAVKAALKAGVREIPGLKIFETVKTVIR
jgi:hypothetical protein